MMSEDEGSAGHQEVWPVFLCYRQEDGARAAEIVYGTLHGQRLPYVPAGAAVAPVLDVYYDVAAPAVHDWTVIHGPRLSDARTLVVICSPGSCARLKDDWVHRELDWWVSNRSIPPILVDVTGDGRWIPSQISGKWPTAQRLILKPHTWPSMGSVEEQLAVERLRNRVVEGIRAEDQGIVESLRLRVEQERRSAASLIRQRWWLISLVATFAITAATATFLGVRARNQSVESQRLRLSALGSAMVKAASDESNSGRDDELALLLARQAYLTDRTSVIPAAEVAARLFHRPISHLAPAQPGRATAISGEARLLAGACANEDVCVWDLRSPWSRPQRFPTDGKPLTALAFSKNERVMAASTTEHVFVWELDSLRQNVERPFAGSQNMVLAVADDGARVAFGQRELYARAHVWDGDKNAEFTLELPNGLAGLSFSSSGDAVTVLDQRGTALLWSADNTAKTTVLNKDFDNHQGYADGLALSLDGLSAVVLDDQYSLRRCPLMGGAESFSGCTGLGHVGDVVGSATFSPDGKSLAVSDKSSAVTIVDVSSTLQQTKLEVGAHSRSSVQISNQSSSTWLWPWVVVDSDVVRVWAGARLEEEGRKALSATPYVENDREPAPRRFAFAPNGRVLAERSPDGLFLYRLDEPSAKPRVLPLGSSAPGNGPAPPAGAGELASGDLVWSLDGLRIASVERDGTLAIWQPATSDQPERMKMPGAQFTDVALSPSHFAASKTDGTIVIGSWPAPGPPVVISSSSSSFFIEWSDDGTVLAAGSPDGVLEVWKPATSRQPIRLLGAGSGITGVGGFSPRGEISASTESSGVYTWKLDQPDKPIAHFPWGGLIGNLKYSPDGTRLVAGSDSGFMTWQAARPQVRPMFWSTLEHSFVGFSPDGLTIAAPSPVIKGAQSSGMDLYSFPKLLEGVCRVVWRNLSMVEWRAYVGEDIPYDCTCSNLPPGDGATIAACR